MTDSAATITVTLTKDELRDLICGCGNKATRHGCDVQVDRLWEAHGGD